MTEGIDLALAQEALDTFAEAVSWAPSTHAVRGGPERAARAVASLRDRLEPRDVPNPSYARAHEAAAAMVLLAATDPARFARLTGSVFGRGIPALSTLEGVEGLDGFLSIVGDDHDYCVVDGGDGPRFVPSEEAGPAVPLLNPGRLLDAVAPLLDPPASPCP